MYTWRDEIIRRFTRFPTSGVNCCTHSLLNPRQLRCTARFLEEFTIRSPKLSRELLCAH